MTMNPGTDEARTDLREPTTTCPTCGGGNMLPVERSNEIVTMSECTNCVDGRVELKPGPEFDAALAKALGMYYLGSQGGFPQSFLIPYDADGELDEDGDYNSPNTNLVEAFRLLEWLRLNRGYRYIIDHTSPLAVDAPTVQVWTRGEADSGEFYGPRLEASITGAIYAAAVQEAQND